MHECGCFLKCKEKHVNIIGHIQSTLPMKRHMDPAYGGKVQGLKYSYSMKRHMDPDYGGKVQGLKYSYSMKRHMGPD